MAVSTASVTLSNSDDPASRPDSAAYEPGIVNILDEASPVNLLIARTLDNSSLSLESRQLAVEKISDTSWADLFGEDKPASQAGFRELNLFFVRYHKVLEAGISRVKKVHVEYAKPIIVLGAAEVTNLMFKVLFKMFNTGTRISFTTACNDLGCLVVKAYVIKQYKEARNRENAASWSDFSRAIRAQLFYGCQTEINMYVEIGMFLIQAALESTSLFRRETVRESVNETIV